MTIPKILLPLIFLLFTLSSTAQHEKYMVLDNGFSIRCFITHQTETHYFFRVAGFYKNIDSIECTKVASITTLRQIEDSARHLPYVKMLPLNSIRRDEVLYLNNTLKEKIRKQKKKGTIAVSIGTSISGVGLLTALIVYGLSYTPAVPDRDGALYGVIPGVAFGMPVLIGGLHQLRVAKQYEKIRKARFDMYVTEK